MSTAQDSFFNVLLQNTDEEAICYINGIFAGDYAFENTTGQSINISGKDQSTRNNYRLQTSTQQLK